MLARAAERGRATGLPYAGAVTPAEAWRLQQEGAAQIVDVRTRPEAEFVGRPPETPLIEWNRYGIGQNPDFLHELARHFGPDDKILFLCRSAARSHHAAAAATQAGFKHAFNILEGFEGPHDEEGHRNTVSGWRKAGLPWVQG
ncbi:rhodanese [Betaproteobacteria bacterium GR16-43]|nr:rhodanese [Betaproteobacteria bacterium GR16-43]